MRRKCPPKLWPVLVKVEPKVFIAPSHMKWRLRLLSAALKNATENGQNVFVLGNVDEEERLHFL